MNRQIKTIHAFQHEELEAALNLFFTQNTSPRWHLVGITTNPATHTVASWVAWLEYENDD